MAAHRIASGAGTGRVGTGAWEVVPQRSPVVLEPDPTREQLELACRALVPFVSRFCRRVALDLREERTYLTCGMEGEDPRSEDAASGLADLADVRRALRRATRMRARPLLHARREVRRLVPLLGRVPLERIVITPESITIAVPPLGGPGRSAVSGRFEICLPAPDSVRFPVFIRTVPGSEDHEHLAFMRIAGHGRCWGEAETLLETAKEDADLSGLVLTALSWAWRNL